MTTPGIFNLLITDDTEQDSYLIAQNRLSTRLKQIKSQKLKNYNDIILQLEGKEKKLKSTLLKTVNRKNRTKLQKDIETLKKQILFYKNNLNDLIKPNINDINQTHFMFINNQYKPFVDFGFNYIKTSVNSKPTYGNEIEFNVSDNGDFISDMLIYIRLSELTAFDNDDRVRYADFIGHKILKKCKFIISNNVLDEYDRELYNIYYNLHVPEAKKNIMEKMYGSRNSIYWNFNIRSNK